MRKKNKVALSFDDYSDQFKQKLERLNDDQFVKWSWLHAVRYLPFLAATGIDYRLEETQLQNILLTLFHSVDICMSIAPLKSPARALELDRALALARALDRALALARALARDLARALARALDRALDLARALALALDLDLDLARDLARDLALDLDLSAFYNLLLSDIDHIAYDDWEKLSTDVSVYGDCWQAFQDVLISHGCEYWADVIKDLWKRGFDPDAEQLRIRSSLPAEWLKKGAAEAAEFLLITSRVGTETLYETRMLILGDAGSGKTSFARRFVKIDAAMPTIEESTRGVDIDYNNHKPVSLKETFPQMDVEHDVNVHMWDFAGQTAVHPIHSLFLAKNCVYVIVYNGRIEAGNHLRYWLDKIRQFGGNSKIYILVNLYDTHTFDKSFVAEKREFAENHIEIMEASIGYDSWRNEEDINAQKEAFNRFRETIARHISKTQEPLPAHVVAIKKYLDEQFYVKKPHLGFSEFADSAAKILKEKFPREPRDHDSIRTFLTTFLHPLGLALHFEELSGFEQIVLNPMWIAGAVYEVIDSMKSSGGSKISKREIESILTNSKRNPQAFTYKEADARYIYRLLLLYGLAYEYGKDALIVPLCMPDYEPVETQPPFPDGGTLSMQFRAQDKNNNLVYMPEEIIPQFIVAVHDNIYKSKGVQLAWRKGVILWKGNALAKAVKTDDSTIVLSAINANGGEAYLRELRPILDNILRNINSRTIVSYQLIDVNGRISSVYTKDEDVQKFAEYQRLGFSDDDYDYIKTMNVYVQGPATINGSVEHVYAEQAVFQIPEKLSGEMIESFKSAVQDFLGSHFAGELKTRVYNEIKENLKDLDAAAPSEKRNILQKIVDILNRPEVTAVANMFQLTGVSLLGLLFPTR